MMPDELQSRSRLFADFDKSATNFKNETRERMSVKRTDGNAVKEIVGIPDTCENLREQERWSAAIV